MEACIHSETICVDAASLRLRTLSHRKENVDCCSEYDVIDFVK